MTKTEIAQALRDWYDDEFINGIHLTKGRAALLMEAVRVLNADEPSEHADGCPCNACLDKRMGAL